MAETVLAGPAAEYRLVRQDCFDQVPSDFFRYVLGPNRKFSCCLFPSSDTCLDQAEQHMLRVSCDRAEIEDGMEVLELGCGWGSLTLWIAQRFPGVSITAVAGSHVESKFIERRCRQLGLSNVHVITKDIREFDTAKRYDRVVCIEMLTQMFNYGVLLHRISNWLRPHGKLFVDSFCHRKLSYVMDTEKELSWMGRPFSNRGILPSYVLLLCFQDDLVVEQRWRVSGEHYLRTCEAWLRNLDDHKFEITKLFQTHCSRLDAGRQTRRWRIALMAWTELFRLGGGGEWFVSHYLLGKRGTKYFGRNLRDAGSEPERSATH